MGQERTSAIPLPPCLKYSLGVSINLVEIEVGPRTASNFAFIFILVPQIYGFFPSLLEANLTNLFFQNTCQFIVFDIISCHSHDICYVSWHASKAKLCSRLFLGGMGPRCFLKHFWTRREAPEGSFLSGFKKENIGTETKNWTFQSSCRGGGVLSGLCPRHRWVCGVDPSRGFFHVYTTITSPFLCSPRG